MITELREYCHDRKKIIAYFIDSRSTCIGNLTESFATFKKLEATFEQHR